MASMLLIVNDIHDTINGLYYANSPGDLELFLPIGLIGVIPFYSIIRVWNKEYVKIEKIPVSNLYN